MKPLGISDDSRLYLLFSLLSVTYYPDVSLAQDVHQGFEPII
jgi:hypothetical protein